MSTKSQEVGKAVLHGIDTLESGAHDKVHSSANSARSATRASARWASRQEAMAARRAHMLQSDMKKQAVRLRKSVNNSMDMASTKARQVADAGAGYVKRKPWKALAIASGAALLVGMFLGRRRT
ncbi:MAG: hypothetical protein QM808_10885 [Steroidobacteraceae bacterium]